MAKLAGEVRPRVVHGEGAVGEKTTELWLEIGKNGYLGINIPEEYGGGGGGIGDIAAVCEELAAQGCPLLLMVVSPAICGTIITRYGTEEQKQRWLPGHLRRHRHDGVRDHRAGRRHQLPQHHHDRPPRRRRLGAQRAQDLHLRRRRGRQRARRRAHRGRARPASSSPCLFVVPTDAAGFEAQPIPMEIVSPELQFTVFFDDVRLPADALVGDEDGGLVQLFAGLNPERIMAASFSTGLARFALDKARAYAKEREVFQDADRLAPGDRAPARADPHRDRDGPADDAEGRRALRRRRRHGGRRGRQHGEVRRRRGRLRRRRPRRADPRRQRHHPGVRHGRPAGRHPRRPDRPGQPRDDPQLRRRCTPWGCRSRTEAGGRAAGFPGRPGEPWVCAACFRHEPSDSRTNPVRGPATIGA